MRPSAMRQNFSDEPRPFEGTNVLKDALLRREIGERALRAGKILLEP